MSHLFIIREEISGEREGKDEAGTMRQEEGTGQRGWVGVPSEGLHAGPALRVGGTFLSPGWEEGSWAWIGLL